MKVLFVNDMKAKASSGASGTEYQTICALRSMGHDVDAIWADELSHRVKHGNLHYLLEQPGACQKAIASRVAQHDYDVIHVSESAAYLAAKHHRKNSGNAVFVCRSHGLELRALECLNAWHRKLGIQKRILPKALAGYLIDAGKERSCRLAAKYADGHIVSCSESQDFLITRFNVSADHIACIPQAPPEQYKQSIKPMTQRRMRQMLFIGPVKIWKGIHAFCEVWNQLSFEETELKLTWVCPDDEWPEARSMLSHTALERTSFIGHLSQSKLMKLYDEHGIFLFPSLFEGFGKAPLEAMTRGLCVVASDTGGMRDVVRHDVDGLLIEPGSLDQLKMAILSLHKNWAMAQRISASARETAMGYSWERVAFEMIAFYEQLIEIKNSR